MSELRSQASSAFTDRWSGEPDQLLLSPGRINLIGDHTDYSLLPVLPMAIQYGIAFAAGDGGDAGGGTGITIDSVNDPAELTVAADGATSAATEASWHRYAEIALRYLDPLPEGCRILLTGDLPLTGGLSSSSALVVGLLAAVSGVGERQGRGTALQGQALADAAVAAERMAAIEGGAMDQTIIVFGEAGAAVRLEFDPPARRSVKIPDGLSLVATYSGEQAAKGASAKDSYNTRVVACRSATALLAREMGLDAAPDPLVLGRLGAILAEAIAALPDAATAAQVARDTGIDVSLLVAMSAGDFNAEEQVPIKAVARHVVEEAAAVDAMEVALGAGDFATIGDLLNSSHRSLQSFGSSTPALDGLTAAVVNAGGLGARVTGAGFGGYAIAGCRTEDVDRVIQAATAATGGPAFEVTASAGIS